jgi:G3E family GTPase
VIRSHYELKATITVVDAVNAEAQRARYPEWLAQISATDRIVITKGDMSTAPHIDALKRSLHALNPLAEIVERNSSPDALRELLFRPARFAPDSVQSVCEIGAGTVRLGEGGGRLSHRVDAGRNDVVSSCIRIGDPLDWEVFTLWFTMLLNRHGDKILRVKGLLALEGADRPAVLHAVQHLVHPVLHLEEWPDASRVSTLVFITEGLDGAAIEASYRRFCAALTVAA